MGNKKGAEMSEEMKDETTTPSEKETQEVLELVEKAQKKGTFDIAKFAKGIAYPEDTVTAYLDIESAYKLNAINDEMSQVKLSDPDQYEKLDAQAKKLSKKILESKVVFHMRGVNQEVIETITDRADKKFPKKLDPLGQVIENEEWLKEWTCSLIASNLVQIENADGEIDHKNYEVEDILELRKHLPREIFELLIAKMQQLTLAGAYFKGLTDAGFLPKS
jgi:hypothetical protein